MKNAKLMLGVAALSAALLGTGYAALTDTLTIGGQVNTASFCVDFEGLTAANEVAQNLEKFEMVSEGDGATKATLSEDKHTINFVVNNLKPGVPLTYATTITNNSSIKAELESVVYENKSMSPINKQVHFTLTKANSQEVIASGTLAGGVGKVSEQLSLEAGEEMPVEITLEWKEGTENSISHGIKDEQPLDFNVQFGWRQILDNESASEN